MKTEEEIQTQLEHSLLELELIDKTAPVGDGLWRRTKGYIEALEWVLGEE